jgi:hypothetical protein
MRMTRSFQWPPNPKRARLPSSLHGAAVAEEVCHAREVYEDFARALEPLAPARRARGVSVNGCARVQPSILAQRKPRAHPAEVGSTSSLCSARARSKSQAMTKH